MLLQIFLAWFYSHVFEYVAHKYLLHNHKKFRFAFKNHFGKHHKISRKNEMRDSAYESILSSRFEIYSLLGASLIHFPAALFFPFAYLTLLLCLINYYILHRKSHLDVEWSKKWLPWHYAHHMGKDQHKNWGVRLPVVDMILKTSNFKTEKA
jgi:sterol desaturase/sphingolipid hydroxylase (fatty acid hydroxylase superfamily)